MMLGTLQIRKERRPATALNPSDKSKYWKSKHVCWKITQVERQTVFILVAQPDRRALCLITANCLESAR